MSCDGQIVMLGGEEPEIFMMSLLLTTGSRFIHSKHCLPGHSGTVPQELRLDVIFLASQSTDSFTQTKINHLLRR